MHATGQYPPPLLCFHSGPRGEPARTPQPALSLLPSTPRPPPHPPPRYLPADAAARCLLQALGLKRKEPEKPATPPSAAAPAVPGGKSPRVAGKPAPGGGKTPGTSSSGGKGAPPEAAPVPEAPPVPDVWQGAQQARRSVEPAPI